MYKFIADYVDEETQEIYSIAIAMHLLEVVYLEEVPLDDEEFIHHPHVNRVRVTLRQGEIVVIREHIDTFIDIINQCYTNDKWLIKQN